MNLIALLVIVSHAYLGLLTRGLSLQKSVAPQNSLGLDYYEKNEVVPLQENATGYCQNITDFQQARMNLDMYVYVNITCPELDNFTFTSDPPFNVLGLPMCGDKVKPKMVLYINSQTNCTLNTTVLPNKNVSECFALLKANKAITKLVILTHGFLNSFETQWLHEMKDAIQKAEKSTAVMVNMFCSNYSFGH